MQKQNRFFDGKDFKKGEFRALDPKFYPGKYKGYISLERGALEHALVFGERPAKRVLEAGVGTGRLIPALAPLCEELVCIDNSKLMLNMAKKAYKEYADAKTAKIVPLGERKFRLKLEKNRKNVKILHGNLEGLSKKFPAGHFDFSCCMWNTLGNVNDDVAVLRELAAVTGGKVLVTVHLKGALEDREAWYAAVGVKIAKIHRKTETVYTKSGLVSKAYSPDDMQKVAMKAGLNMEYGAILNNVVLWAELSKK